MEFTKNYRRETVIDNGIIREHNKSFKYERDNICNIYGQTEKDIVDDINRQLGDRWPITIEFENTAIFEKPNGCGYMTTEIITLVVIDNYAQRYTIDMLKADVIDRPNMNNGNHYHFSNYTKCDDIKLVLDNSLYPRCDYDIANECYMIDTTNHSILLHKMNSENKILKEENSDLKNRMEQMEKKMNTLMEFIMLMK